MGLVTRIAGACAVVLVAACSDGSAPAGESPADREPQRAGGAGMAAVPSSQDGAPTGQGDPPAEDRAPADGEDRTATAQPSAPEAEPAGCRAAVEDASTERFAFTPCDPSIYGYNGISIVACPHYDGASHADFAGSLLQPAHWVRRDDELVRLPADEWGERYPGDMVAWISVASDFYESPQAALGALETFAAQSARGWGLQRADCADCEWPTEEQPLSGGRAVVLPGWLEVGPAAASSAPVMTPGHQLMRLWAAYDNVLFTIDGMAFNAAGYEPPREAVLCEIDAIVRSLHVQ